MLNSNWKFINNRLSLRPPQTESLNRFIKLCDTIDLPKFFSTKSAFRKAWFEIGIEVDALPFGSDKSQLKEKQDQPIAELTETYKPICAEELAKVHALFPTLTSFERDFPSIWFALATGIGKTW